MEAVTVTLLEDDYQTKIEARQHVWYGDTPEDEGGGDTAPTPEELVMGALGSCMAMTGKMYANRKGWQIDRLVVELDFERFSATDYPAYTGSAAFVHEIRERIIIEGPLDEKQKDRICEIMGKCPVRRLIANPVFFVNRVPQE